MTQLIDTVSLLLGRELRGFKREIDAYPDDASVWATPPGIANSAGSLARHCAGNVQHFIGACLGGSGYVRDRDAEFAGRPVPRAELLAEIDRALEGVRGTLDGLSDHALPVVFPDRINGKAYNSDVWLLHVAVHLGYHLGQADYHRRLTTGDSKTVGVVAVPELPSVEA